MGKAKRKRKCRRKLESEPTLNHNENIIQLKRWMCKNGWNNNPKLLLKDFCATGRGVYSKQALRQNDTLIEVPYDLLISYTTLNNSSDFMRLINVSKAKLRMQDMLALFISMEKLKGFESNWKIYIDSLPENIPYLPALELQEGDVEKLPKHTQNIIRESMARFSSCWQRVSEILINHHQYPQSDKLLSLYKWAYAMVNTRVVYTNPEIVHAITQKAEERSLNYFLLDEPSMALCPFLDMFNHSCAAETDASLELVTVNGSWVYRLKTLKSYKKHQQIFINYGAHNNNVLWNEYGFFLPNNPYDLVTFYWQEILSTTALNADETQYKFIKKHNFDDSLSVSLSGMSYNLKALLYVLLHQTRSNWNSVIFSDQYESADMQNMHSLCVKLLQFKLEASLNLRQVSSCACDGHITSFWDNCINLIRTCINNCAKRTITSPDPCC